MFLDIIIAIAVALVPLFAAWIGSNAVPWIKARTTAEQRKTLMALIHELVYAAEQLFKTGVIKDRLEYVMGRMRARDTGLPDDEIRDMVEAAVLDLHIRMDWGMEVTRERDKESGGGT